MLSKTKLLVSICVCALIALSASAQQTVNVSPGDDLQAAVDQAGAGGTVVFAPGVYNVVPSDPEAENAIELTIEHDGITLQGAGSGLDPETATILNGDAGFLGSAFRIEELGTTTIENFTLISFWEAAVGIENIDSAIIRNCWMLASAKAVEINGFSGLANFDDLTDVSQMIQFYNCVMAKGQDVIKIEDECAVYLQNCDVRDGTSDIIEVENDSLCFMKNCIFNAGLLSDDIQPEDNAWIKLDHCVFYKVSEPDGTIDTSMDGKGLVEYDETTIYGDPMYVNANFRAAIDDLDFHLLPDSPALTAGIDEEGNPTFAGSAGPAQE